MKSFEEIERLIDKTRLVTSESADKRIIEDAKAAFAESRQAGAWNVHARGGVFAGKAARVAAAVLVVGVGLWMLHYFGGGVDMSRPAFAEVVENLMSQKWVYMFEENRKSGTISAEYWYNPGEQKVFMKSHTADGAFMIDLTAQKKTEYRNGTITISSLSDFNDAHSWLSKRFPMINGLLESYEEKGAVITQRPAMYNKKRAWLYEIELILPDGSSTRTHQHTWLVDTNNNLPIICEYKDFISRKQDESYKETVIHSSRWAFDYSDSGPADIYAIGVRKDSEVIDTRPNPEIQGLIDKIDAVKAKYYNSYAAIIFRDSDLPRSFVMRDGYRSRRDHLELGGSSSDIYPRKDQYLKDIGDSFESVYQWINKPDSIIRPNTITFFDKYLEYRTSRWDIKHGEPMETSVYSGRENRFLSYCWWGRPSGKIIEDDYSKENGLICTLSKRGGKRYLDPNRNYLIVRGLNKEGKLSHEITEFAVTGGGMHYPRALTVGGGQNKYRIYAADLNDSLRPLVDPKSLPNYVDHRQLTRERIEERQSAVDSNAPVITEYTGFTPLHMAVFRQDLDRVKSLLGEGAEVECAFDSGATPMELAVASGNLETVKLLYDHGADFISNDGEARDCVGLAAKSGHYELVEFMLAHGSDANSPYKANNRPLHYAAKNRDVEMVELLLANGAKIELKDREGQTALFVAVYDMANNRLIRIKPAEQEIFEKFKAVCTLLIEAGADINATDKSGMTALSASTCTLSCEDNNRELQLEFLKFVLECGADPDKADSSHAKGNRPLDTAVSQHRFDFLKLLLESGVDPWLWDNAESGRPYQHLLYSERVRKNDKLYDLLYPYMKQRYEQTNAKCLKAARQVVQACLTDNAAAIADLCIDNPDYKKPWDSWPEKIKRLYKGHEQLFDGMVAGEFTLNGFAEVYIPLPEGMKEKSVLLGFIQCPNGQWKCMSFQRTDYMPEFGQAHRGNFLHSTSFGSVKNFRKHLYNKAE